jgi:hypothetical protein
MKPLKVHVNSSFSPNVDHSKQVELKNTNRLRQVSSGQRRGKRCSERDDDGDPSHDGFPALFRSSPHGSRLNETAPVMQMRQFAIRKGS